MKSILFCLVLTLASVATNAQDAPIVVIDFDHVIEQLPEYEEEALKNRAAAQALQDSLNYMAAAYEAQLQQFQDCINCNASVLSAMQIKLEQLETSMYEFQDYAIEKVKEHEVASRNFLLGILLKHTNNYSRTFNLGYVVDDSAFLYFKPEADHTERFLDWLGIRPD